MKTENAGYRKDFQPSGKKRARPRNNFINQDPMYYAIYRLLNAKDITEELTMLAYGNQQNAIVHTSKQLRFVASTETFNGNRAVGVYFFTKNM